MEWTITHLDEEGMKNFPCFIPEGFSVSFRVYTEGAVFFDRVVKELYRMWARRVNPEKQYAKWGKRWKRYQ